MRTFLQWAQENSKDLPCDTNENTKRGGIKPGYPDAYVRGQYPDGYFPPISATAPLDLKNSKSK